MKSAPTKPDLALPTATLILLLGLLVLGGCAGEQGAFGSTGLAGLNPFGASANAPDPDQNIVLARDPAALASGTGVEVAIYNAVELARQKRFTEARNLLAEVRALQPAGSDAYAGLSSAMALLALSEGDIATFRRIARALDRSLGAPVRVAPAHLEVITLYRAITGQDLPVNAPERMKPLRHLLPAAERALAPTEGVPS